MTIASDDAGQCARAVARRIGPRIVLALPLGIGKPILFVNELFRIAASDPSIDLTILTALSLARPRGGSDLERRFLEPLSERIFGDAPDLEYLNAIRAKALPANIHVVEFYFEPGARLTNPRSQQDHLCANYTHVAREVIARGVNLIAHLVARREHEGSTQISLGSNPDVTVDLLPLTDAARAWGQEILLVGEVHPRMPFMLDRALIEPQRFDYLIDDARGGYELFCPPNPRLGTVDHAIGLFASTLVRDDGTLQVGIGELGDALVNALLLRQKKNALYRETLERIAVAREPRAIDAVGGREPFGAGIFASTEMFVDQLFDLYRADILVRRVFDDLEDQKAADRGEKIAGGRVMHAGFFLGPRSFYAALRELPEHERELFGMRGVGFINQLYGEDHELRVLQRCHARFVNTTMMVTLLGAAISDGLDDGRVVSGVGGQYNFVSMAHALDDGRSILCLRSTREKDGRVSSNIRWSYGHCTIPRHLRDIVVTEYGAVDLRGRTDQETIVAMLEIADSRFQEELLEQAKAAGKVDAAYKIPAAFRNNTRERLESALESGRRAGCFEEYPFGTDLTAEEIVLAKALEHLKANASSFSGRMQLLAKSFSRSNPGDRHAAALKRMRLDAPRGLRERILRRLLLTSLDETRGPQAS